MSTLDAKRRLGVRAREKRRAAHSEQGAAAAAVQRHFLDCLEQNIGLPAGAVVAGYWTRADELDVRPLLAALDDSGYCCALPVAAAVDAVLAFRRWRTGDVLTAGRFGIMEPGADAEAVTPELVIVPLLAWDRAGYRLGYGAGYYDRTLRALRGAGPVVAVGVGFAAQGVDAVPHDAADERLDWVVTETGAVRIES